MNQTNNLIPEHQVLARKWRPRCFSEMVGQTHIVRALTNALAQNRIHHAYLFTGTRGIGKTTLARILAKCLNCKKGVTATPCGTCESCVEIDSGRFIDLIEVDAASRTKVEDTRELLDNVQYAPTKARYKIYLIDEVHMLSGHSFNALLKTLEEPPPHVKFLLATTDPQKLPATVLSRCLQFHLKNLSPLQIAGQLKHILEQEHITFELDALDILAQAANGSVRDALSLLDQAIALGNENVNIIDVNAMLGNIEHQHLVSLFSALIHDQPVTILDEITKLAEYGADFTQVLEELLSLLHQVAIAQAIPTSTNKQISEFAHNMTAEEVQLYYQIGLIGRRDLPLAPTPRSGFEMIMLRMLAFKPSQVAPQQKEHTPQAKSASPASSTTQQTSLALTNESWHKLIGQLNLQGISKLLAEHCVFSDQHDDTFELLLDPNQKPLLNDKVRNRLKQALSDHFGKPIKVNITISQSDQETPAAVTKRIQAEKQASAEQSIQKDHNIQAIISQFNGKIIDGSIEPLDH